MSSLFTAYCLFIGHNLLREILRTRDQHRLRPQADRTSLILIFYQILVLASPFLRTTNALLFTSPVLRWAGVGLMLGGLGLHLTAMRTLEKHYRGNLELVKAHLLITHGIYSVVRHPGYLGNLLIGLGFGLATGSWLAVIAIVIVFFAAYTFRIRQEEKMLTKTFGQEYKLYSKSTSRLIPYVY
jgi:protein-S-isoprenylcysteine O-methyltransferase Ste14